MIAGSLAALGLNTPTGPAAVLAPTRLLGTLAALALVLMAILLVAWLLKRFRIAGTSGDRSLKVLEVLPIGQRERLLVIDWEGQRLLIACTASGVVRVAERPAAAVAAAGPAPGDFASRLRASVPEVVCAGP